MSRFNMEVEIKKADDHNQFRIIALQAYFELSVGDRLYLLKVILDRCVTHFPTETLELQDWLVARIEAAELSFAAIELVIQKG